MSKENNEPG